ncbi:hypothetical protein J6590_034051 [Homalodisca vitripennis]|nr:hypothetical protein J6590_034051 [Homalodisca vitripennis]
MKYHIKKRGEFYSSSDHLYSQVDDHERYPARLLTAPTALYDATPDYTDYPSTFTIPPQSRSISSLGTDEMSTVALSCRRHSPRGAQAPRDTARSAFYDLSNELT